MKNSFAKQLLFSATDLLPIMGVVSVFQIFVVRQPIPDVGTMVLGAAYITLGLTFFIQGLEKSLFPLGLSLAFDFASKGSLFWLLLFAAALGFGTTIAEPALVAVADKAAVIMANGGIIAQNDTAIADYAWGLRLTVALSVGFAILVGIFRIIKGWQLHYLIIGGYGSVAVLTIFAPAEIIGIAYDCGGVTTSTITVPLVTALGVGLASAIKGRNPMLDGFGLIAFASLTPMMFVMVYGMAY